MKIGHMIREDRPGLETGIQSWRRESVLKKGDRAGPGSGGRVRGRTGDGRQGGRQALKKGDMSGDREQCLVIGDKTWDKTGGRTGEIGDKTGQDRR